MNFPAELAAQAAFCGLPRVLLLGLSSEPCAGEPSELFITASLTAFTPCFNIFLISVPIFEAHSHSGSSPTPLTSKRRQATSYLYSCSQFFCLDSLQGILVDGIVDSLPMASV